MKNATQLKDLIRNVAKQKDINSQILMRNYMLERLLERNALSDFKDKFILKGGMLVAALVGVDMRSTMDMDATIKGYPVTSDSLEKAFLAILSVPVDDGVTLNLKKLEAIRVEDEYNGYRLSLEARLENLRVPMKVDITTGDEIAPQEISYTFDLLLENRSIEVLAYNIETVLAEKLETIVSRGIATTRMRDFYDIYILMKLQRENIEPGILSNALKATAEQRGSVHVFAEGSIVLEEIFSNGFSEVMWERYQRQFTYADEITWNDIKETVFNMWILVDL